MGSPKEEYERFENEDQVSVTVKTGFWLGKFEVTQGEWERLMGTTIRQQQVLAKASKTYGEGRCHLRTRHDDMVCHHRGAGCSRDTP